MSIEAMKQMVEALEIGWSPTYVNGVDAREKGMKAIAAGRQAIAEAEKRAASQEPVAVQLPILALDGVALSPSVVEQIMEWGRACATHPQPKREPLTPVVPDGANINQRISFKAGWRAAEAAHGIKGEA